MGHVLITGAAGYIGRHLCRAFLARGLAVRGLDLNAEGLRPLAALGVESVVADAGDLAALRAAATGAALVYHLAGSALGSPATIVRANSDGARAVAAACAGPAGPRALIFASSGALYPNGPGWIDEETPPAPAFGYARAKYAAEQALLEAHAAHGLPVIIARIGAVYGPDNPSMMLPQLRRGHFPLIGGGYGYASYIHIDDVVAALMTLADAGRAGRIYNLTDDEPAPVREFYGHLARLLNAPPPPGLYPLAARALVWLANGTARLRGRPAPLPPDLAAMASVSHRISNRRIREELGLTLKYPTYREGLPPSIAH